MGRKYFVPQSSAPLAVWEAGHSSPERNRQLSEQFNPISCSSFSNVFKKFKFLFIGTTINVAIDKCYDISFHGTQSVHLHSFLFFRLLFDRGLGFEEAHSIPLSWQKNEGNYDTGAKLVFSQWTCRKCDKFVQIFFSLDTIIF